MTSAHCGTFENIHTREARVKGPIRVGFLTSIRDVGGDDRSGQMVDTENGTRYMEGVIEHTLRQCLQGGALHNVLEVAAIITDDRPGEPKLKDFCAKPADGESSRWIFPLDLACDTRGTRATTLVHNLPSEFRRIPKTDPCRAEAKRAYEKQVLDLMRRLDANVLISEHYMALVEYLIKNGKDGFGLYGKVLNIHPAVTCLDSPYCLRGDTPTADALKLARSGTPTKTGATLHIMNEKFDDGPIIEWAASTPVYANDTPEALRYRNYRKAKLPVFVRGMYKYVSGLR